MKRKAIVLIALSSLTSIFGIGNFAVDTAERLAKFLSRLGVKGIQILPLAPTGAGNSPYGASSSFAMNPYYLDPRKLAEDCLISWKTVDEMKCTNTEKVDYGFVYVTRKAMQKEIAETVIRKNLIHSDANFQKFLSEQSYWIMEYSLYRVYKIANNDCSWQDWNPSIRNVNRTNIQAKINENKEDVLAQAYIQYLIFQQYKAFKAVINSYGIEIIGDVPMFVQPDSQEAWAKSELFLENYEAGTRGSNWGLMPYNYNNPETIEYMKKKFVLAAKLYDSIRIDNIESYSHCYIYEKANKRFAGIINVPGYQVFSAVRNVAPNVTFLGEDLGEVSQETRNLMSQFQMLKMSLFYYATNTSKYLPSSADENTVIYTTNHDTPVLMQMLKQNNLNGIHSVIGNSNNLLENRHKIIEACLNSKAPLCVVQMQDILGSSTRMNDPNNFDGNWTYRIPENYDKDDAEINFIANAVRNSGR